VAVPSAGGWEFWIDRGGTFTDVVARSPAGALITLKLLSEDPAHYNDASVEGIRRIVRRHGGSQRPLIASIRMGTTLATNALLERKGEPTGLVITAGFGEALRIGYQNRPQLFTRHIRLPELLYAGVIEARERVDASGQVLVPLDEVQLREGLKRMRATGLRSLAIVFMHGYAFPAHEKRAASIARELGFEQVSASHEVAPLIRLIARGDTTVVDGYLSPLLMRYVRELRAELGRDLGQPRLYFMQSNGGLTDASAFRGMNSIVSGPAGGLVGMVKAAGAIGYRRLIGFDMGGTSTDVSLYDGEYPRRFDSTVAGVRLNVPMMSVHTVAAGGGSVLHFSSGRFQVGPQSAGANPGPASYGRGGPLTVTDINVLLGRLQPEHFPSVLGPDADQTLDVTAVRTEFERLARAIERESGLTRTPEEIATGFLQVAVGTMANAIKHVSVRQGHDAADFVLFCFGGAAAQHACLVAESLGIRTILVHPLASLMSAYGIGLADVREIRRESVERILDESKMGLLQQSFRRLENDARLSIARQGFDATRIAIERKLDLQIAGTDAALSVGFADLETMREAFDRIHQRQFGFGAQGVALSVSSISVEAIVPTPMTQPTIGPDSTLIEPLRDAKARVHVRGRWREIRVYQRSEIEPGTRRAGPALIIEPHTTVVLEPGWTCESQRSGELLLRHGPHPGPLPQAGEGVDPHPGPLPQAGEGVEDVPSPPSSGERIGARRSDSSPDPVLLEVFNSLFMHVAEQMGAVLEHTAASVNIKERLDFSCALFDGDAGLIANAPHMPVHLGSMGASVQRILHANAGRLRDGDVYMLNAPYQGGTHLPDITVITPVFLGSEADPQFFVASRAHHADIGGITPGSMPPASRTVHEEGVLFDNFRLVIGRRFEEQALRERLAGGPYPARNPQQNIADLKAQIAANEKGVAELLRVIERYGAAMVRAYMQHIQDNAEECVRRVITRLRNGSFRYEMDNGQAIAVSVAVDHSARSAVIDFTGTSPQLDNNFNAPVSVCAAAVLYVFRTLIDEDIPLNAGCFKPLRLVIPEGCMLNPRYPAAVVAGNVETSQCIVDALYGALGVLAAAQGTMNNFTFGDERHQYYETLAGGSGAGPDFDGTAAVQTHMTNSRLTDPEILELRYPVLLREFRIRTGSGGAGRHRGGDGAIRRIEFRQPMTASILANHRRVAPFGLAGGMPGRTGINRVVRSDGSIEDLPATASVQMNAGDQFVIETPGGGGFGKPEGKSE
jgi:5-oxoprolinase (ATP-hydrolysing)